MMWEEKEVLIKQKFFQEHAGKVKKKGTSVYIKITLTVLEMYDGCEITIKKNSWLLADFHFL
jgi:hypothetical protein